MTVHEDFARAMDAMTRDIVRIEEKIAEIAFFLTDVDKRDRLEWIAAGEPWADDHWWHVPARSIACGLR